MRFIQFIISFQSSNKFLEFKFGKRNFGKENLINSFGPDSSQCLATVARSTRCRGERGGGGAARARGRTGNLPGMVEGSVAHHGGPVSVRRRRSSGMAAFSSATALRRAMVGPGGSYSARPTRRR
jgi:hypothetical protein